MTTSKNSPLYFYRPLAYFGGHVLKCAGIATADNADWFPAECGRPSAPYSAGCFILTGYRGDRIDASTLEQI